MGTKLQKQLKVLRPLSPQWTRSSVKKLFGTSRNFRSINGARTPARDVEARRRRVWKLEKLSRRRNRA